MALARAERAEFAALLHELTPEQWAAPTLCTEWPVRDVVAHVISYEELDKRGLARRYVRGRFVPRRVNAVGVAEYAGHRPEQLVELLERHLQPQGLTAGFGGRIVDDVRRLSRIHMFFTWNGRSIKTTRRSKYHAPSYLRSSQTYSPGDSSSVVPSRVTKSSR